MCVTFVTCEVRVCGLSCRSGSSLYIYRVYLLLTLRSRNGVDLAQVLTAGIDPHCAGEWLLPAPTPPNSMSRADAYARGPPLPPLGETEPRTLVNALRRAATALPVRGITFVSADDSLGQLLSYAQLLEGAVLHLGAFQAMGIRQGEPLLMQVAELHDHIIALWGCLLGGIAPVNIASPPKYDATPHSRNAPSGLHVRGLV